MQVEAYLKKQPVSGTFEEIPNAALEKYRLIAQSLMNDGSVTDLGLPLISLSTSLMELQKLELETLLLITWKEILMEIHSL